MITIIKNNSSIKNSDAILLVRDYYYGHSGTAVERAKALGVNIKTEDSGAPKTVVFTVYDQEDGR